MMLPASTPDICRAAGMCFIALTLWVSAGCGFQLRGDSALSNSLPELAIQTDNQRSPVILELKRWLRSAGVNITEAASTTLTVSDISHEKRTIAYDSRGKTALYELTSSLSINVLQKGGKVLLKSTTINARQPYSYNESDTSAKDEEEALLQREMNASIVRRIMRQLEKLPTSRQTP